MANPFANIQDTPYVSFRTALPLDQMRSTGEVLQGRWEANKSAADILENSMSNVLTSVHDKDRVAVEAFNQEVSKTLDAYAKRGDYHNLSKELSKLSNQYAIRVKPALEERAAIEKDIEEIRKRQDMTDNDKVRAIEDINRGYTGVEYDKDMIPIRKTYTPRTYASSIDANAIALDYAKGWNEANWGISPTEVRTSLTETMKTNPQVVAYKQNMMDINRRKYAEMVRSGQISQEQMDQQLKKDDENFELNIIKPAIDQAVEKTAYYNVMKSSDSGGGGNSSRGESSILTTSATPVMDVHSDTLKDYGKDVDELKASIARENDPGKRAEQQVRLEGIKSRVKQQVEEVMPDIQDKIDKYYTMYVNNSTYDKGDNPLSKEEFTDTVMNYIIEDPGYKVKLSDLAKIDNENNPAVRRAVKALRHEINKRTKDISIQREATIFKGTAGSKEMRTFTGEYTKLQTDTFSENVENYTINADGAESGLDGYLNKIARDPSKDKIYPTSMYKDGKFYQALEYTKATKKGKPEIQSLFIAPKDQTAYQADLTKIAKEYMSDQENEANFMQGVQLAAALTFGPMVEQSGFERQASGIIPGLNSAGRQVFYQQNEDTGAYDLFLRDPLTGDLSPFVSNGGKQISANNINDLQMKLFMNSPSAQARFRN